MKVSLGLSPDTMTLLAAKGHKLVGMDYKNQIAAIQVGAPKAGAGAATRTPIGAPLAATDERLYGVLDPRFPTGSAQGF